jgi:hypothetical protein
MPARRRIAHDRPALSVALRGDETLAEGLRVALARGGLSSATHIRFTPYPAGMHAMQRAT